MSVSQICLKTCVKSALEKYGRNYFYKETSIGVTTSCYSLIKHLISKVYTWQKKKKPRLFKGCLSCTGLKGILKSNAIDNTHILKVHDIFFFTVIFFSELRHFHTLGMWENNYLWCRSQRSTNQIRLAKTGLLFILVFSISRAMITHSQEG